MFQIKAELRFVLKQWALIGFFRPFLFWCIICVCSWKVLVSGVHDLDAACMQCVAIPDGNERRLRVCGERSTPCVCSLIMCLFIDHVSVH